MTTHRHPIEHGHGSGERHTHPFGIVGQVVPDAIVVDLAGVEPLEVDGDEVLTSMGPLPVALARAVALSMLAACETIERS